MRRSLLVAAFLAACGSSAPLVSTPELESQRRIEPESSRQDNGSMEQQGNNFYLVEVRSGQRFTTSRDPIVIQSSGLFLNDQIIITSPLLGNLTDTVRTYFDEDAQQIGEQESCVGTITPNPKETIGPLVLCEERAWGQRYCPGPGQEIIEPLVTCEGRPNLEAVCYESGQDYSLFMLDSPQVEHSFVIIGNSRNLIAGDKVITFFHSVSQPRRAEGYIVSRATQEELGIPENEFLFFSNDASLGSPVFAEGEDGNDYLVGMTLGREGRYYRAISMDSLLENDCNEFPENITYNREIQYNSAL